MGDTATANAWPCSPPPPPEKFYSEHGGCQYHNVKKYILNVHHRHVLKFHPRNNQVQWMWRNLEVVVVKVKLSLYGPDMPRGLLKLPRTFTQSAHEGGNVVSPTTGRLYPQRRSLVPISVSGWVDPRYIVRSERLSKWKNAKAPSGIATATFWLVSQWINKLRHRAPIIWKQA